MFWYHDITKHSYFLVRTNPQHLDWAHKPSVFKRYESALSRIGFEELGAEGHFLYHIGAINAKKSYPGVAYYLRINPAAGALYPNELYVQIRDVEGVEDGIYHYEIASSSLTLLHPLPKREGLEPFVGVDGRISGYLFLVMQVPWRSAWKYRDRAFRYCLLDGGHLLGAIELSAYAHDKPCTFKFNVDRGSLNRLFGFGLHEAVLSAAIVGTTQEVTVAPLQDSLPSSSAFEHFRINETIAKAYMQTALLKECAARHEPPRFAFEKEPLLEAIYKRRSARAFVPEAIDVASFELILQTIDTPIPSDCDEEVDLFIAINRVLLRPSGLFAKGSYLRYGDVSKQAGYLALEQYHLASDGALAFFMTSRGNNYQALYQKAGIIGQRLYIAATYLGLGCSGIGAYYDDEVCEFLGLDATKDMVLYMMAGGVSQ